MSYYFWLGREADEDDGLMLFQVSGEFTMFSLDELYDHDD